MTDGALEAKYGTVHSLNSWEDCATKIGNIESRHAERGVWFRGQSKAKWQLLSTLERGGSRFTLEGYFNLMRRIKPEIEASVGPRLNELPAPEEVRELALSYDDIERLLNAGISSMAYLRHHGFPSPLLDWSASPDVAAYFAFAHAKRDEPVAIFVYVEAPDGVKVRVSQAPQIFTLDSVANATPRHNRQKSKYTVCSEFSMDAGWSFVPHQEVFRAPRSLRQDFVWKLIVPASERPKVLASLDQRDINAFSLFQSEDSLMETLAVRHFS